LVDNGSKQRQTQDSGVAPKLEVRLGHQQLDGKVQTADGKQYPCCAAIRYPATHLHH